MDIIQKLNSYVNFISNFESISATLKNKIVAEKKERYMPENYYYLTHLINPLQRILEKLKS